jgi:1-acyl-sn-glycerol-3-phosphate acyltransferase
VSAEKGVRYPARLSFFQIILGTFLSPLRVVLLIFWLSGGMFLMTFSRAAGIIGTAAGVERRRALARLIARGTLVLMGVRIIRSGRPPSAPFYLVANHLSWLDSIVFMAECAAVFVSMEDVRRLPGVGILVESFGTIFIERRSLRALGTVSRLLGQAMDRGDGVMMFPEADTSRGDELLPFSSALLQLAVDRGRPVHSAAVALFSTPGYPEAGALVAWADWTPIFSHIVRMLAMPMVTVRIAYSPDGLVSDHRGKLSQALRERISSDLLEIQPAYRPA